MIVIPVVAEQNIPVVDRKRTLRTVVEQEKKDTQAEPIKSHTKNHTKSNCERERDWVVLRLHRNWPGVV